MNYFEHCKTPEEAKSLYKKLAKELHPDMAGGKKEPFQKMEEQYRTFLSSSFSEMQKEYSNISQFTSYITDFFKDNPELMQVIVKSLFKSDMISGFIKNNANIIDAGIGIYKMLKQ